jgi:hypothetical protein
MKTGCELLRVGGFLSTSEYPARPTDQHERRITNFPCVQRLQTWCCLQGSIKELSPRKESTPPSNTDQPEIYEDRSPHPVTTCGPDLYKPAIGYVSSIPGGVNTYTTVPQAVVFESKGKIKHHEMKL